MPSVVETPGVRTNVCAPVVSLLLPMVSIVKTSTNVKTILIFVPSPVRIWSVVTNVCVLPDIPEMQEENATVRYLFLCMCNSVKAVKEVFGFFSFSFTELFRYQIQVVIQYL